MSLVVVVGDQDLYQRTRQLLPNFQVIGLVDEPELADPVTSVGPIRSLIDSTNTPDAVVSGGSPGFTVLSQIAQLSPSRCYVYPGEAAGWPPDTLRWIAEATGMSLLPQLESLPAAILARGAVPAGPADPPLPAPPPQASTPTARKPDGRGVPTAGGGDYSWADATPVQVPPPPVSLDKDPVPGPPQVIDAGPAPRAPETAYLPTDVLRPLRPRDN
ncbi:MAG: hypothetical protein M0027_17420 [Candidatus Dormibacteraeota bacterium]|jgi:hypothetical protein|nr:hypothetical protein [Candidatus Dormibacteraeota bacterium]